VNSLRFGPDAGVKAGCTLDYQLRCALQFKEWTCHCPLCRLVARLDYAQTDSMVIDGKDACFACIRDRRAEQLRKVFNELRDPGQCA